MDFDNSEIMFKKVKFDSCWGIKERKLIILLTFYPEIKPGQTKIMTADATQNIDIITHEITESEIGKLLYKFGLKKCCPSLESLEYARCPYSIEGNNFCEILTILSVNDYLPPELKKYCR